jgi:hypothetical protein
MFLALALETRGAVLNKMKKRLTWQWRQAGEDNSYGG